MLFHRFFVKIIGFTLHHVKRVPGALPETGAQAVAVFFRHQAGLAIDDLDGPLGARRDTLPAAVALFFLDLYDFAFYFHFLPAFHFLSVIAISASPELPVPVSGRSR